LDQKAGIFKNLRTKMPSSKLEEALKISQDFLQFAKEVKAKPIVQKVTTIFVIENVIVEGY